MPHVPSKYMDPCMILQMQITCQNRESFLLFFFFFLIPPLPRGPSLKTSAHVKIAFHFYLLILLLMQLMKQGKMGTDPNPT